MPVGFDVTNQKASPALYASSLATRPAASFVGRLFVDTDTPSTGIYRDTGTVWLSISGGSSETQSLNDVCVIGNTTTTLGILINGQSTVGTHDSSSSSIPPEADFALTIGEDYPATGFSIYTTHKNHFAGVLRNEGTVVFDTLGGTGSRIVVASADGTLTASAALSSYVTGSGTTNYVPKFTSASAIGNSQIFDNGTNVGIGTASPTDKLSVNGNINVTNSAARYIYLDTDNTGTGKLIIQAGGGSSAYGGAINLFSNAHATKAGWVSVGLSANSVSKFTVNSQGLASGTDLFTVLLNGNTLLNSTTDNGYKLDVNGTGNFSGALTGTSATFSSSVRVGNFTTVQKNALTGVAGMVVYDTTLNKLCVYTTAWETITSI